jgi:ABC-2 type transport system ATP-binding protein
MAGPAALEAAHLSKRYGDIRAVDDVSLCVEEGTVVGFIGPNGAGKTTVIRMVLGLVTPSSGEARIFGHDVQRDFERAIRAVGALVEGLAFYPFLSARRNLRLFGGLSGGVSEARLQEVLELVGLGRRGDQRVKGYSQGMRQRLGIALALLEEPRMLILDEPTNGLDPQGTREIRALIRRIRDEGRTTVLLSSHLLAEMELICDRVAVIARGRVLREGRLDELLADGAARVELRVADGEDERARSLLAEQFGTEATVVRRGHLEFSHPSEALGPVNRALVEAGLSVRTLAARRRTLEQVFVGLTGESQEIA